MLKKEKSIVFSTEEVRATVDGRKTMTRTVVKHPEKIDSYRFKLNFPQINIVDPKLPYRVGDILWVRETWSQLDADYRAVTGKLDIEDFKGCRIVYKADENPEHFNYWRPSINMPRAAARLFLKVKDIRVERLQDITEQDILAEGTPFDREIYEMPCNIQNAGATYLAGCFMRIWDSINAKRGYGWDLNPWVWVIEFERAEGVN